MQCRQDGGDQASEQGDDQREHEHAPVEANRRKAREVRRCDQREDAQQRRGQYDADGAAHQAEQHGLGHQLPHEPPLAGAECGAHRHFLLTCDRPDEQQVRDVGARDQEHDAGRAEQNPQRLTRTLRQHLLQRHGEEAVAIVRVVARHLAAELLEAGARLLAADALPQPADDDQKVAAARARIDGPGERNPRVHTPHLGVDRGRDADDGVRVAVDGQRRSDQRGAAAESALPQLLADDDHLRPARTVLVIREIPAGNRRSRERSEEAGARPGATQSLWRVAAGQRQAARSVGAHLLEDAVPGPPIHVAWVRRRAVLQPRQLGAPHLEERPGIGERHRGQQDGVDDAEERGVDAGAEREGEKRCPGHSGKAPQQACTVAEVLPESFHAPFDGDGFRSVDPGIVPAFKVVP